MKLPQAFRLTPKEVGEAIAAWLSSHKFPGEPAQAVSIRMEGQRDGSMLVILDEPLPKESTTP